MFVAFHASHSRDGVLWLMREKNSRSTSIYRYTVLTMDDGYGYAKQFVIVDDNNNNNNLHHAYFYGRVHHIDENFSLGNKMLACIYACFRLCSTKIVLDLNNHAFLHSDICVQMHEVRRWSLLDSPGRMFKISYDLLRHVCTVQRRFRLKKYIVVTCWTSHSNFVIFIYIHIHRNTYNVIYTDNSFTCLQK